MAFLTSAVTALTLAGTPGLPVWDAPFRVFGTSTTRLSLGGTPGRPYGSFTKSPPGPAGRTYSYDFTRLGTPALPAQVYGAFAGKASSSGESFAKSDSVIPILTIGQFGNVDIDLNIGLIPRAAVTASVGQVKAATETLRPVFTIPRAQLLTSGSALKVSTDTLTPVLAATCLLNRPAESSDTLTPVFAVVSAVDDTYVETLSSDTLTPVFAVSSAVDEQLQFPTAADTLTPVWTEVVSVNRVTGAITWSLVEVIAPRLAVSGVVSLRSGDVDSISITGHPYGYIDISTA